MKVSVALCTFNGERWIEPFLASLVDQTRLPDELVVSDDGSGDATVAIIESFARVAPFPVLLTPTADRLGSTMNFGRAFARCHGDLVAPADQDDLWLPTKLERLHGTMVTEGVAMAFSDGGVIDGHGAPVDTTLWAGVGFDQREQRRFARDPLSVLVRRSVVTGAAMMFRADQLDRLLPFPPALNAPASLMLQDRWIALVLAAVAEVRAVPEPLISFREHPDQQTGLRQPASVGDLGRQLRRSSESSAASLSVRAAQLEAVRSRLRGDARSGADRLLARAVGHLSVRAALPGSRLRRVPSVTREWLSGGYRRCSGGSRSAVADLVRPAR